MKSKRGKFAIKRGYAVTFETDSFYLFPSLLADFIAVYIFSVYIRDTCEATYPPLSNSRWKKGLGRNRRGRKRGKKRKDRKRKGRGGNITGSSHTALLHQPFLPFSPCANLSNNSWTAREQELSVFERNPSFFLLHPLVPLSVIILLIIISIRDGSKYYSFVSNSLINQISLWRGYDFLARSDRWKREEIEITLLLILGAVSDSPLLLILPFQIPREPKITRNLRRLEEFFLPVCVKKKGERRGKISGNKFRSISLYVSWISRNNGEREGRKEEKKERRVARESCCS